MSDEEGKGMPKEQLDQQANKNSKREEPAPQSLHEIAEEQSPRQMQRPKRF